MTTATLTYSADTYQLDVVLTPTTTTVEVAIAHDTYQLTLTYSADTYQLDVVLTPTTATVEVAIARDAYQLALADGFVGTRAEWLASLVGITSIHLTLAEYLALPAGEQTDPAKIYTIPKII